MPVQRGPLLEVAGSYTRARARHHGTGSYRRRTVKSPLTTSSTRPTICAIYAPPAMRHSRSLGQGARHPAPDGPAPTQGRGHRGRRGRVPAGGPGRPAAGAVASGAHPAGLQDRLGGDGPVLRVALLRTGEQRFRTPARHWSKVILAVVAVRVVTERSSASSWDCCGRPSANFGDVFGLGFTREASPPDVRPGVTLPQPDAVGPRLERRLARGRWTREDASRAPSNGSTGRGAANRASPTGGAATGCVHRPAAVRTAGPGEPGGSAELGGGHRRVCSSHQAAAGTASRGTARPARSPCDGETA
jgi:hypothetical protein